MWAVPSTIRSWSGGELVLTWVFLYAGTFAVIHELEVAEFRFDAGDWLAIFVAVSILWLAVTWIWMGRER